MVISLFKSGSHPSTRPWLLPILVAGSLGFMAWSPISHAEPTPEAAASPAVTPSETPAAVLPVESPSPAPSVVRKKYELDHVDNGVFHFNAPTGKLRPPPLKTHLFDSEFIGLLHSTADTMAYVLLTGLACAGCKDQKLIFLSRVDGRDPHVLAFPGKIRDKKTGALLHDSTAYYGNCLKDRGEGYFLFQKEKVDRRRHLQESVNVIHLGPDGRLHEKLETARRLPKLITAHVKGVKGPKGQTGQDKGSDKKCFQIPGYERETLSFRVPHLKGGDEREKEEQEREKELESAPESEREDDPAAALVPE